MGILNKHEAKRKPSFDRMVFLAQAGEGRTIADYHENQVVFSQGDQADAVFYVQKGQVKLTVASEQGKEAIIGILGAGQFLGEDCLAGQSRRMATAVAMSKCSLTRVEKSVMLRVLHDEPSLSEAFLSYLLSRKIRVEQDVADQLLNPSEKRLARVLLLLANLGNEGKAEPVKISQETLAEIVGTTRPRVNFFMNKFRRLGLIDYNDGLEVHSSLLHVILHDRRPHARRDPEADPPKKLGRSVQF